MQLFKTKKPLGTPQPLGTKRDIFTPVRKVPKALQEAAALLGAEGTPQTAVTSAAETLWIAAIKRYPSAQVAEIAQSIPLLVQAVFEMTGDRVSADKAAQLAASRVSGYRVAKARSDRKGNTSGSASSR